MFMGIKSGASFVLSSFAMIVQQTVNKERDGLEQSRANKQAKIGHRLLYSQ
jgi:hypothetical protein